MNKPKWLELVLLAIWTSAPIVGATIVCRYFQMPFLVYCFVAIVALILWFVYNSGMGVADVVERSKHSRQQGSPITKPSTPSTRSAVFGMVALLARAG